MTLLLDRPTKPIVQIGDVTGDSQLGAAMAHNLGLPFQPIETLNIESSDQLLIYFNGWHPAEERRINRRCHHARRPWLRVRLEGMHAEIGPLTLPDQAGCQECAELRRYRASQFPEGWKALQESIDQQRQNPSYLLTNAALEVLTQIVGEELEAWRSNPDTIRTNRAILRLNLEDLRLQRHRFQPDTHCETCGQRAADSQIYAKLSLRSQVKPLGALRLRNLKNEKDLLLEQYVDGHVGLVNRLVKHTGNLYANASASTLYPHQTDPDRGFGRGMDFQVSQLSALMEVLERYGGMRPNSKQSVVRGSYQELSSNALKPSLLGLHGEDQYASLDFPFRPYTDQATIDWVWACSMQMRQPILVPEGIAYYGLPLQLPGFAYECSNGCAIGSSLEEAILYGMLEVVERDAFLMTWHAKLELPEIDLQTVRDPVLRLQIERLQYQSEFKLRAFDATMEHGIPVVWLMAISQEVKLETPSVLCAAGSHLSFEKAIANAIGELAPNAGFFQNHYQKHLDRINPMINDNNLCRSLEDHQLLYAHPEMRSKFDFLLNTQTKLSLSQVEERVIAHLPCEDLRDDLERLMERFFKEGHDIIVVDQTAPEHRQLGFHCVKVLIPGLIPMTFGHKFRRLHNLPRLLEVPQRLGFRSGQLSVEELRIDPHPFA